MIEHNNYRDFKQKDWRKFFSTFSQKIDQVNERLNKAEQDRDIWLQELTLTEAKLYDRNDDSEE